MSRAAAVALPELSGLSLSAGSRLMLDGLGLPRGQRESL